MNKYSEQELRAYLYQQAQELGIWARDLGSLAVFVDQGVDLASVTFVLAPESLNVKVRAEHEDFFEACRLAKDEALKQINLHLQQVPAKPNHFIH